MRENTVPAGPASCYAVTITLLTAGVITRCWMLWRRKASVRKESGFKVASVPVTDILLLLIWAIYIVEVALTIRLELLLAKLNSRIPPGSEPSPIILSLYNNFQDLIDYAKQTTIVYFVFLPGLWLARTPLYAIYLSTLQSVPRWLQVLIWVATFFHVATFLETMFMHLFWCGYPAVYWTITDPRCQLGIGQPELLIPTTVFCIVSDVFLMIIGLSTVLIMRVRSRREILAVAFILAIGLLSLVATIIRASMIPIDDNDPNAGSELDPAWAAKSHLWFSIEGSAAAVSCNLPTFRNLLRKWRGDGRKELDSEKQKSSGMDTSGVASSGGFGEPLVEWPVGFEERGRVQNAGHEGGGGYF